MYICIYIYREREREGERQRQRETERERERDRERESTCLIVACFENSDLSLLYLKPSNLLMSNLKHYLHGSVHKKFLDY